MTRYLLTVHHVPGGPVPTAPACVPQVPRARAGTVEVRPLRSA